MRTQKISFLIALLLTPLCFMAQETKKSQAFWVHEDVVKPSMVAEYESVCKELMSNVKKHNIKEMNNIVARTEDNRYMWVGPIENMAQLDQPVFGDLPEKMGADKMGALFDRMDKCYDIEQNYIIHLDNEMSYMPGGISQTIEGEDYRKFHYFHYTPGNRAAVNAGVKAIKDLFESKGSKLHYRVYRSGFGTRGAFFMVAVAAKDAADYANRIAANNEAMGEEWQNTYNDFMATLDKYEVFEAVMLPELGYSPSN